MRAPSILAATLALSACTDQSPSGAAAAPIVELVDSVTLEESDSAFVASPAHLTVGEAGSLYVTDPMSSHVLKFGRDGQLLMVFGRKGSGPGEFLAPVASALVSEKGIAISDVGAGLTSLLDRTTGRLARSVKLAGFPFSMHAVGDTVWISAITANRNTGVAVWNVNDDSVSYRVDLPAEYIESPALRDWHPYASVVRLSDGILVGYTGHPDLFVFAPSGAPIDTVTLPAVRRRKFPDDLKERLTWSVTTEEVAGMQSTLAGLYQSSSGEIVAVYMDATLDGKLLTAEVFVSLLNQELTKACLDIPIQSSSVGRPTVSVSGDTLLVLEQVITASAQAATRIRYYRLDSSGCEWEPLR